MKNTVACRCRNSLKQKYLPVVFHLLHIFKYMVRLELLQVDFNKLMYKILSYIRDNLFAKLFGCSSFINHTDF